MARKSTKVKVKRSVKKNTKTKSKSNNKTKTKSNNKTKSKSNNKTKSKTKSNNKTKSKSNNKTKAKSNKNTKKSCYKLSNPYHDVLIDNYINNKNKMSNSDKKKLCKIIDDAINKGKDCLQEADITINKHKLKKFNC